MVIFNVLVEVNLVAVCKAAIVVVYLAMGIFNVKSRHEINLTKQTKIQFKFDMSYFYPIFYNFYANFFIQNEYTINKFLLCQKKKKFFIPLGIPSIFVNLVVIWMGFFSVSFQWHIEKTSIFLLFL